MRVLVAENEPQTLDLLSEILSKEGFETLKALDGEEALELYQDNNPDFICLDIMMPGMSGIDVCKEIRKTNEEIPIIFISAKGETIDKIIGLEMGGDDYIIKPFDIQEVITRIRTVARRCLKNASKQTEKDEKFQIADIEVIPNSLRASRSGNVIDLSLRDIKILKLLHQNRNQIVHRDKLLDVAWGQHIMPESRTVDWHISQLRKKIEIDPKEPTIIQTVHGVGYKYEE